MSTLVRTQRLDGVLHVELHRPERRNAISRGLMAELREVLEGEDVTRAVAVVVSGAGGAFSAGADLGEITGTEDDASFDEAWAGVIASVRALPRPVIAAIEGPCRGAAVDLVLACDVRVVGTGATLGVPAVRLGLLYRPDAVARMHRIVGSGVMRRLLLVGDTIDAVTARELGLVHEVVSDGEALAHASALAGELPPESVDALAATKRLLTDLDESHDLGAWDQTYLDLLRSPGRRALLGAAQERHRARASHSDHAAGPPAGPTPQEHR